MRKMRKWAALWVAAALVLGGCSSGAGGEAKTAETPAASQTAAAAESKETAASQAPETPAAESGQAGETGAAVKANEKYKITLVVKNLTNPMWIAVQEGAEKAAAEARG